MKTMSIEEIKKQLNFIRANIKTGIEQVYIEDMNKGDYLDCFCCWFCFFPNINSTDREILNKMMLCIKETSQFLSKELAGFQIYELINECKKKHNQTDVLKGGAKTILNKTLTELTTLLKKVLPKEKLNDVIILVEGNKALRKNCKNLEKTNLLSNNK